MGALQALRTACGFPFVISSGYRCPDHPVEQSKDPNAPPGEHTLGKAADVLVYGSWARDLVLRAADFPRLGIDQTGDFEDRFVHLGTATEADGLPSPTIWSY